MLIRPFAILIFLALWQPQNSASLQPETLSERTANGMDFNLLDKCQWTSSIWPIYQLYGNTTFAKLVIVWPASDLFQSEKL